MFTLTKMGDGSNDFIIHRDTVKEFIIDLNSPQNVVLCKTVGEHLLKIVTFSNLEKYPNQAEYSNIVNKILLAERKKGDVSALFESSTKCMVLPTPIRKTVVQTILQIFFGRLMAMFQIGIKEVLDKLRNLMKKANSGSDEIEVPEFQVQRVNNDVLRYVGGFVVRSLIRKKCPQSTIEKLTKEGNLTADETESWVIKLSRGGLINISDEFYELLLNIKQLSDKHYCINYELIRNQKLKDLATQEVLEDADILKKWGNLHMVDELDKWLNHILDTFLNTRGKCLTKDITELFQHITKSSIRAKKALRKKLKEKEAQEKTEPKTESLGKKPRTLKRKMNIISNENELSPIRITRPELSLINQPMASVSKHVPKSMTLLQSPTRKSSKFNLVGSKENKQVITRKISTNSISSKEKQPRKAENIENQSMINGSKGIIDLSFLDGDPDADIFLQFL